ALCGSRELVERARRLRKMWGGGMRQSGILAAGALHALENHRARLATDHANAKLFAERMSTVAGARVDLARVETNIVNVDLDVPAADVATAARELGLLVNPSGPRRMRAVTHLDVTTAEVADAAEILGRAAARIRG
ncbi:MAG: low specificity L-threonine aldolase, partial [Rubrivivax sp.]|nr:low specificity L-threonine aldolase [Rubrivivax sp.]